MKKRMFFNLLIATLLVLTGWEAQAQGFVKKVNCTKGQTITRALQGFDFIPITIQIQGTCNENVEIIRDNVTLIGDPSGGGVNGIDPHNDTIRVRASRTIIDGLTITGGYNGITVNAGATIQNSTIKNAGVNGIAFYHGGHGLVNNCTITNNPRWGILVEAASATITNSTISLNAAAGILVKSGGGARIGIPDRSVGATSYAGNMIKDNQSNGIEIFGGAGADIGGNTISGNGTNLNAPWGQFGIFVNHANADIVGGNTITSNVGSGILLKSGSVLIGDAGFGLPTDNAITGNGFGSSNNPGGILAFMGTSLDIRNATITGIICQNAGRYGGYRDCHAGEFRITPSGSGSDCCRGSPL
jgi:hypothetical protein